LANLSAAVDGPFELFAVYTTPTSRHPPASTSAHRATTRPTGRFGHTLGRVRRARCLGLLALRGRRRARGPGRGALPLPSLRRRSPTAIAIIATTIASVVSSASSATRTRCIANP
jgi:hypothetical protein